MELFKLTHLGKRYYFTSHKEDIQEGSFLYKAIPISRTEVTRGLDENGVKIIAPIEIPPFNKLFINPVAELSEVEILRYPEMFSLYKGKIIKTEIDYAKHTITIYLGQEFIINKTQIPKRSYSSLCGYNFCDEYCEVNREDYRVDLVSGNFEISDDGLIITSGALSGVQYLNGGFVKTDTHLFSYIMKHNGGTLQLLNPLYNKSQITTIMVYPTCDKSPEACNYFNNLDRFGGFPYIPENNIVTGGF